MKKSVLTTLATLVVFSSTASAQAGNYVNEGWQPTSQIQRTAKPSLHGGDGRVMFCQMTKGKDGTWRYDPPGCKPDDDATRSLNHPTDAPVSVPNRLPGLTAPNLGLW